MSLDINLRLRILKGLKVYGSAYPTPTPSITPTITPTITITPTTTSTLSNTSTPTVTPTITPTQSSVFCSVYYVKVSNISQNDLCFSSVTYNDVYQRSSTWNPALRVYDNESNCVSGIADWGTTYNRIGYSGNSYIINSNGDLSNTVCCYTYFTTGASSGFNNVVTSIEGYGTKTLVGGSFTTYRASSNNRLIMLDEFGNKETLFNVGTGFNGTVATIATQSDGKILVGGRFNNYNSNSVNNFVRLNSNGSLDSSFGGGFSGSSAPGYVYSINVQTDGKILVGGLFSNYSGNSLTGNNIIRLNSDGSIDSSFSVGVGTNSEVYVIKRISDKIYVGGTFTSYSAATHNRFVRLNLDGTIDTSFNIGSGFSGTALPAVNDVVVTGNQTVCIAGVFTTFNGASRNSIVYLTQTGSENSSFVTSQFTSGAYIQKVALANPSTLNEIFVCGIFDTYGAENYGGLIYLRNGTTIRNPKFKNQEIYSVAGVYAIYVKNNLDIIYGGNFTSVQGISNVNYIAITNRDGISSLCL